MGMRTNRLSNCPQCGAPLPGDAPGELCPRCIMSMNLASQTAFTGEDAESQTLKKEPPSPEEIKAHFPQFTILECLGRGGMGVVYKAIQKSLDRVVALKILAPEREKDPQFASRFAREAKTLAQLSHPNIVTVHDFGEADGMYYLVMEYVDGISLRHLLREQKLAPQEALAIVPPVCEALQYAHDRGVVHRDIKPENLLLDKQGRIKIADFGIAKLMGPDISTAQPSNGNIQTGISAPNNLSPTDASKVVGTPTYMAPEQSSDPGKVDHRADIYSLGVVLYEMLTGELPVGKFQPPSKKIQIDVRLDEIVLHALEKEPNRRYQTASQVGKDVETLSTTQIQSAQSDLDNSELVEEQKRSIEKQATLELFHKKHLPKANALLFVSILGVLFFYICTFYSGDVSFRTFAHGKFYIHIPEGLTGFFHATVNLRKFLAILTLIGAICFRQFRNYAFALIGCVSALITSLAMCVFFIACTSTPMIILWSAMFIIACLCLKVLLQREVQEVFCLGEAKLYAFHSRRNLKWSIPALIGAGLVAISLLHSLTNIVLTLFGFYLGGDRTSNILSITLSFIDSIILILGWLGWEEMQRSNGKLRGMGFAMISLMFPVIELLCLFVIRSSSFADYNGWRVSTFCGTLILDAGILWYFHFQEKHFLSHDTVPVNKSWWPLRPRSLWILRLSIIIFVAFSFYRYVSLVYDAYFFRDSETHGLSVHRHQLDVPSTNICNYRWESYAVELESISRLDATIVECWLPNGTFLCRSTEQARSGQHQETISRQIALKIILPTSLPDVRMIPFEIQSEGVFLHATENSRPPNEANTNDRQTFFILAKVSPTAKTLDLSMSIPYGKWEDTDASWNIQNGLPRHAEKIMRRYGDEVQITPYLFWRGKYVDFSTGYELIGKRGSWTERMIALDKNGTIYKSKQIPFTRFVNWNTIARATRYYDFEFVGATKSDIQELRIQVRPVRHLYFKNISIVPENATHPEVVVDDGMTATNTQSTVPYAQTNHLR